MSRSLNTEYSQSNFDLNNGYGLIWLICRYPYQKIRYKYFAKTIHNGIFGLSRVFLKSRNQNFMVDMTVPFSTF